MDHSTLNVDILIKAVNQAQAGIDQAKAQIAGVAGAADEASVKSTSLSQKLGSVGSSIKGAGSAFMPFSIAAGAALGASIYAATTFEQKMELVHTQAGASQKEVDNLKNKVLELAPAVGQSPQKLADSLFFIESAGFRGAKAMDVLKLSAEGAAVGQTDVAQTANALTSALNSGITGAETAQSAMGALNAIVGAGKMHFEDLNGAISTGFLSAAKSFGISLDSVGAALATLTREGEPADEASTRLRMAMTLMAAPTSAASKALQAIGYSAQDAGNLSKGMADALSKAGVTTNQMAEDLRKPDGIQVALVDLQQHLEKSGLNADQASAVIARAFGGGRTAGPIITLLQNTKELGATFDQIKQNSGGFASAWAAQQQTAKQHMDDFKASIQTLGVKMGDSLLPQVTKLAGFLTKLVDAFSKLSPSTQHFILMALGIVAALAPVLIIIGQLVAAIGIIANPITLIVIGIGVLIAAIAYLVTHFSHLSNTAKIALAVILGPIFPIIFAFMELKKHWGEIEKAFESGVAHIKQYWHDLQDAWNAVLSFIKRIALDVWNFIYRNIIKYYIDLVKIEFMIIKDVVTYVFDVIRGAAIVVWNFLYNGIIKPVIDLVIAYFRFWYNIIVTIWNDFLAGAKIIWNFLWANIIKPVLDIIVALFTPVVNAIKNGFQEAWNFVVGLWNGIVGFFEGLWNSVSGAASSVGNGIKNAFSAAFNEVKSIARSAINAVIDIINGAIHGINNTAGKLPGVPKIGDIPHLATGTTNFAGGLALVGEQGPELAILPGGSQVLPATQTQQALNGGTTNISVNVNVGVYAGQPGELRTVATTIYQELQRIARQHGVATNLPNIGILPQ